MNDFDRYTTLSFDCYGTLIDWENGIATALRPWAVDAGLAIDDQDLVAAHARHETHVQQANPVAEYPEVLADTLRRIGSELGVQVSEEDATAYGQSVGEWPAFPDSADALGRLAERFKLVILSNIDRTSFAESNKQLGVEFDLIVTAQDVGSYKPDPANFEFMFDRLSDIGSDRTDLVHVAESLYHDHEPAQRFGLPSVWIDRRHDREGSGAAAQPRTKVEPLWRFTSLGAFADAALDVG